MTRTERSIQGFLAGNADSPVARALGKGIRSLLLSALRRRVPVVGYSPALVRAGALLSAGADPVGQGRQACELVESLLAAGKPPTKAKVVAPRPTIAVNLLIAKELDLHVPIAVVRRAARVVRSRRPVKGRRP